MINFGKWIAKHKTLIVIISILLLIPAAIGFVNTRVNYDLLNYLPENLETMEGQDILLDEFGMGAFSMVVVENMQLKDVQDLKQKMLAVDHVKDVFWYDSLLDITVPMEMLPEDVKDAFNSKDATLMVVLFDTSTSAEETMNAIDELRSVTQNQCFISGMSSIVTDVRNLSNREVPIYVMIACILSLIVLGLTMESILVPFLFLLSIGMAILYNMGTNMFLGDVSYVTQSLAAVLQLAVTMDYSIFLLNSYEENKERFDGDKNRAMAHAISNTFKSVAGSSVTTIAGFLALCFMTFTLGMNIGVVMAKGVVLGVLSCITVLPAFILTFDKLIDKTTHKPLVPNLEKISNFIMKYHIGFIVVFLLLIFPAVYGNNHVNVYYNMDKTLPADLPSSQANTKLDEKFGMNAMHLVMIKNDMSAKDKMKMIDEMKKVDGVKWVVGLNSIVGPAVPESMIPSDVKKMLKSDNNEIMFVSSDYKTATDEVNAQIDELNGIVKKYSETNMVIGEAPLTKDLINITAVDFRNVSIVSIGAIFIIILIVFKSVSLPIILVSVIEFSILVNMAVSYYTGVTLPFIASIVIGTIQLGATVDYAILMTSKYQKHRNNGLSKKESISLAHKSSMKSILISGLSFFAATFGVGMYSEIDMISSLCTLLSRGAIISTIVVIFVLPALFMIFDPIICKTSIGFGPKKSSI